MKNIADLLRAVLRGGQPLQATSHLHWEDHWDLQGEEEARGAAPRVRHHRHRLQVRHREYQCELWIKEDIDDNLYSRSMLQGESEIQIWENILITPRPPLLLWI